MTDDTTAPSADERLERVETALVELAHRMLPHENRRKFWTSCPSLRALVEERTGIVIDLWMNS